MAQDLIEDWVENKGVNVIIATNYAVRGIFAVLWNA